MGRTEQWYSVKGGGCILEVSFNERFSSSLESQTIITIST